MKRKAHSGVKGKPRVDWRCSHGNRITPGSDGPCGCHVIADSVVLQVKFEKLVAEAARRGIAVVADSDAMALSLRDVVDRGDDLRRLGDIVQVHGACGGMTGSGGGHPHGVY
jgi:hypothetical protein